MRPRQLNVWVQLSLLILLGALVLLTLRQSGCRPPGFRSTAEQTDQEDEKKKKKIRKPDFLSRSPTVIPGHFARTVNGNTPAGKKPADDPESQAMAQLSDPAMVSDSGFRSNRVKQGHWYSAYLPIVANHFNVDGSLDTYSTQPGGKPVSLVGTNHRLTTTRPVSLARGEWKNLEASIFIPVRNVSNIGSINVDYSLNRPNVSLNPFRTMQPTLPLQGFQHHFVVLGNRADTWSFLKLTDSFQLRGQTGDAARIPPFYAMVTSIPGDPLPLSRNPLQWTTIAYVLWDDLEPERLDPDQQNAMLDWIHHGGQLIVSGPDSLDSLQTSFLARYLPAAFDGTTNLIDEDVAELNQNWSIPNPKRPSDTRRLKISDTVPLLGVRLEANQHGQFIDGTGKIAIEQQVGRGRIVVTAFSLNSPVVKSWPSFQGFLNGALLRKPARRFGQTSTYNETFKWVDRSASEFDPMLGSTLRFLSRDLGSRGTLRRPTASSTPGQQSLNGALQVVEPELDTPSQLVDIVTTPVNKAIESHDPWRYGGYQESARAGVGSWNDDSGIANSARESLQEAAGITPPSADFVLKMLAGYLLVLVPFNWLVFRLIGRVEWAWAAAPLIAIGGAFLVVRLASLDIGFVRSNTEVGVVEIYADHPRAHLTQYAALYTSLSTRYKASLDNASSLALPFATIENNANPAKATELANVILRRTVTNQLENFFVQSNSTGMLHVESMLDLGGTISLTENSIDNSGNPPILSNSTSLNLLSTGVIRRLKSDEKYEIAWVGELNSGQEVDLKFEPVAPADCYAAWAQDNRLVNSDVAAREVWDNNVAGETRSISYVQVLQFPELQDRRSDYVRMMNQMHSTQTDDDSAAWTSREFAKLYQKVNPVPGVSAGRLFATVAKRLQLGPGEVRLLAVNEEPLGRTRLTPRSTQTFRQTLVVAHLQPAALPKARRDANVRNLKRGMSNLDYEEEMQELESLFDQETD